MGDQDDRLAIYKSACGAIAESDFALVFTLTEGNDLTVHRLSTAGDAAAAIVLASIVAEVGAMIAERVDSLGQLVTGMAVVVSELEAITDA